jgi:hypothetical protein
VTARFAAASSWPLAAAAAEAQLAAGRSAVDAVVAGFFAAAGDDAGILLAPAVALVAGGGAGARAFDGRAVQPGREAQRPRGFLDGDAIPPAARVAAPRSVPMAALLVARHGRAPLRELVRPGVDAAEKLGETGRASLLSRIAATGVLGLHNEGIAQAMLGVAGVTEGGAMSRADWIDVASEDVPALEVLGGSSRAILAPSGWRGEGATSGAVLACDGRGLFAALAVQPIDGGVEIPGTGVRLPMNAEPVRRGVTRDRPGAAIPMHAPIAIAFGPEGAACALALPGGAIEALSCDALFELGPAEQTLLKALQTTAATTAFAVVAAPRVARAVSLAG